MPYPGRADKFESPYNGTARGSNSTKYFNQAKVHQNLVSQNQFPGYQDYPGWREREQNVSEKFDGKSSSIYREAFQNSPVRKKSKLSVHFAARVRSYPVDGSQKLVLSRKQILASLDDKICTQGIVSVSPTSSFSSSSSSPSNSENSSSSTLGGSGEVFSRACLLWYIAREESDSHRFGHSGQVTLDTYGDTTDSERYDSTSEASEEETQLENFIDWEELDNSFISDNESLDEEFSASTVTLASLTWVATLGVGGYGRVELVTGGADKIPFALKKMKKIELADPQQRQHILAEKSIMQSCSSPFIVRLYQTFQDSSYLYMLMEPCLGGELWTVLRKNKRFNDSTARFYVGCVILALDYLHEKGVIYRDLKPENILLNSSGYIKLTDFGFAKQLAAGEKAWTFCGTPEYVAPEIITNKSHDYHVDIWSLGILVYELLTGVPPFTNKENPALVYPDILKGIRSVHFPNYISASASEIIRQCCRLSPSQRPSLKILKHFIWFAGLDWVMLADRSLTPPSVPRISSAVDTSNFDSYNRDLDEPEEDFSDWAANY